MASKNPNPDTPDAPTDAPSEAEKRTPVDPKDRLKDVVGSVRYAAFTGRQSVVKTLERYRSGYTPADVDAAADYIIRLAEELRTRGKELVAGSGVAGVPDFEL